jgi:hypothetical protein
MIKKPTGQMAGKRPSFPLVVPSWITGLTLAVVSFAAQGQIVKQGTEYNFARMAGDQVKPALALSDSGGIIAWEDNATDGDGSGISARWLNPDGTARGERFRINQQGAGQQEKVAVTIFPNGARLFVWQGGLVGSQGIFARWMNAEGIFISDDVLVSPALTVDNRNPSIAVLADGSAVIVWSATGSDGSGSGVLSQRVSSAGQLVGEAIPVNQFQAGNQRNPTVSPFNSGFVVAWISDEQTGSNRSDLFLRPFASNWVATGSEVRVNTTSDSVAEPVLLQNQGQLWVGWSRLTVPSPQSVVQAGLLSSVSISAGWSARLRRFDSNLQPIGGERPVSSQSRGSQTTLSLAAARGSVLAVWLSDKLDGSGKGVGARVFDDQGASVGDTFVVNTITRNDQIDPIVAASSSGRFLVAWSDWRGLNDGQELSMQRFVIEGEPLVATSAPIVSAMSSWQVRAAWPPVQGLDLAHYEVLFNGAESFRTSLPFWTSPDVLPGTTHSVQVSYVLTDGRRSPLSLSGSARTWGKDNNGDGIPDDWQAIHFGSNSVSWPLPTVDSDGDGVSDRDEFLSGTDPRNPDDALRVVIRPTPQGSLLEWKTSPGGVYVLQGSTDLTAWQDIGGNRFASSSSDSLIVSGALGNGYFRVKRIH